MERSDGERRKRGRRKRGEWLHARTTTALLAQHINCASHCLSRLQAFLGRSLPLT